MPNWVLNRLVISGSPRALQRVVDALQGPDAVVDFERHVPAPAELARAGSPALRPGDVGDGVLPDWHGWRVEHWGTKWNAQYPERLGDPAGGEVDYRFSTAYSPPAPWLRALARAHPRVEIVHEYCEEFMQCCGRSRWSTGKLVAHEDLSAEDLPWLPLAEDDEDDEDGEPEPEPAGELLDRDAVVIAARAVEAAYRHACHTTAGWATQLTIALGAACAEEDDAAWHERLAEAAAIALGAALDHELRANGTGNVLDWRKILVEVAEDAFSRDDHPPTGTTRCDWQLHVLDYLGSCAEAMTLAQRAWLGWDEAPEAQQEARDWLALFAATCVQAIAATCEPQH